MNKDIKIIIAALFAILCIAAYWLIMSEKNLDYKDPTVSQCKQAAKIVTDVAPLFNLDKGYKLAYVKRIFELTDDPQVRLMAQHGAAILFAHHAFLNMSEINKEVVKNWQETSEQACNKFELK